MRRGRGAPSSRADYAFTPDVVVRIDAPFAASDPDKLVLSSTPELGFGPNLQVLFGGGWRLYGDQGYRWGLDATLRWLIR